MKVLALTVLLVQLVNFGAAQCVDGWTPVNGRCMQCSRTISGGANTFFTAAQRICIDNRGNLATITNSEQETYAIGCVIGTDQPWIGYTAVPFPAFIDGTSYVNYGALTATSTPTGDCWLLNAIGTWVEETASNCAAFSRPFVCTRSYESCYELEVSGETTVNYTPTDSSTGDDGKRWVGTTATYSCNTGYSVSGTNTRICGSNGTWSGSAHQCVAAAVCSELTASSESSMSYSTTASGSFYITGTVATQVCNFGYDKKSGTDSRTCQSTGAWTGSAIVCEKGDNNDELAIGLGVGLGVPLALALCAVLFMMCRRAPALPRPALAPRPAAYPRPAFRPPYPRRMGPRPFF